MRVGRQREPGADRAPWTSIAGGGTTGVATAADGTGFGGGDPQTRLAPGDFVAIPGPKPRPAGSGESHAVMPHPVPLLPGEHTPVRQLCFALVNACTLSSLGLGISAIFLSMRGEPQIAAAFLIGCVILDGFDGALARRLRVASPFGAQMDSLADMCSFGIAAPVVFYGATHDTAPAWAVAAACALVGACAAIRLARFNISPKDGRFFSGVPTTMTAAVLGLATLIGLRLPGAVLVAAITVLALAMISSFPYAKLARLARMPVWLWVIAAGAAYADYRLTFLAVVALYLVSGPLVWLRERQRQRA